MPPPGCSEFLLQLLQRFIKHHSQVHQIHSLLITRGHLFYNPNYPASYSPWKTTLLYNTVMRAYLNFGQNHGALYLFTSMLAQQTRPNGHTFTSLFKAAMLSSPSTGFSLHNHALKRGVLSDPFVQTSLMTFYSQIGDLLSARKVFEEILYPCIVEYNAMLDAFAKNGDLCSLVSLFERMPKLDVVSWTTVINGLSSNGLFSEAVEFFRAMMVHDDVRYRCVRPNEATFVSVLSACANADKGGAVHLGKQIHGYIVKNVSAMTTFTGTALIDFYGKVGCLANAIKMFNQVVIKKVYTWNAMISSLANNGREKQTLDMFQDMKKEGVWPNEVTFVAVLSACARAKLVEVGLQMFKSMLSEFGVVPLMEHYGCVVDLLGRAGLLREAHDFMKNMPFEPDASVLGALLGACKIHGAIELANEVGRRLLELQPKHCGQYIALSNINAEVERWTYATDVRKKMVEAGVRKVPAYSLIGAV